MHAKTSGATVGAWEQDQLNSSVRYLLVTVAVHCGMEAVKRRKYKTRSMTMAMTTDMLQTYLEEFTFRFNRRTSHRPGLLFYRLIEGAVASGPLTYDQLAKIHRVKRPGHSPMPPTNPQLVRHPLETTERPWRDAH